jgi:hypothetical protein
LRGPIRLCPFCEGTSAPVQAFTDYSDSGLDGVFRDPDAVEIVRIIAQINRNTGSQAARPEKLASAEWRRLETGTQQPPSMKGSSTSEEIASATVPRWRHAATDTPRNDGSFGELQRLRLLFTERVTFVRCRRLNCGPSGAGWDGREAGLARP